MINGWFRHYTTLANAHERAVKVPRWMPMYWLHRLSWSVGTPDDAETIKRRDFLLP